MSVSGLRAAHRRDRLSHVGPLTLPKALVAPVSPSPILIWGYPCGASHGSTGGMRWGKCLPESLW